MDISGVIPAGAVQTVRLGKKTSESLSNLESKNLKLQKLLGLEPRNMFLTNFICFMVL